MNQQASFLRPWLGVLRVGLLVSGLTGLRLFAEDFSASTTFNGVTTNTTNVHIGFGVSDITIVVTNGGQIINTGRTQIGYPNAPSSNTTVIVTGGTSLLTNTAQVAVGRLSASNTLLIANGGRVYSTTGFLGGQDGDEGPGTSNNLAVVTGANSSWNMTDALTVGITAGGNRLVITNGGRVVNTYSFVGNFAVSENNQVIVTGTDSGWSNTISGSDGFYIGLNGGKNQLIVSEGGRVDAYNGEVGFASTSRSNSVLVTGGSSLIRLNNEFRVGNNGMGNQVTITNGGQIINTGIGTIGRLGAGSDNLLLVTGVGSLWSNGNTLVVGRMGAANRLQIENGGRVESVAGMLGGRDGDDPVSSSNNIVVVTGIGSIWNNSDVLTVGRISSGNQLIVTNGGRVVSSQGYLGDFATAQNNRVIVTGAGSTWSNTAAVDLGSLVVGSSAGNNQLIVSEGGRVDAYAGNIGFGSSATNNSVFVTGNNALLNLTTGLRVGVNSTGNQLVVTNGGTVSAGTWLRVGVGATSSGTVLITGQGSTARGGDRLSVGANGDTDGSGSVLVTDSGVLEFNELRAGSGGSISNRGGIYQFTVASPTLSPTGSGIIMMTNGTVSFRGVTSAPTTPLANLSQQGNNGLRLNNASNAVVASYTFDSVANTSNPSNYRRLALINNSRWTSANLTIGTGGGLTGTAGDVVEITQSFTINRNVNTGGDFDLASSRVLFSGGTGHTNAITGDDFGHSATLGFPDGFTAQNFSYGRLSLGSTNDTICFQCGELPVAPSNALYVTWLDLLGNTNNVANLHAPSTINIYYLLSEANNAYLNNAVYQLTDCNGGVGGLLMPAVPEPSSVLLLSVAGIALLWKRRRG